MIAVMRNTLARRWYVDGVCVGRSPRSASGLPPSGRQWQRILIYLISGIIGVSVLGQSWILPAQALPPADEIPEEILRAQPSLRSYSALDNQPLTPTERQALEAQIEATLTQDPELAPELKQLIFLLRLRKAFQSIFVPQE